MTFEAGRTIKKNSFEMRTSKFFAKSKPPLGPATLFLVSIVYDRRATHQSRPPTFDQCKFRPLGSLAALRVAVSLNFCLLIIKIMRYITSCTPLAYTDANWRIALPLRQLLRRTQRRHLEKYIREIRLCVLVCG